KPAHIPSILRLRPRSSHLNKLSLHVEQAFFHCPKYIRTNVAGLTAPAVVRFNSGQLLRECQERARNALSFLLSDFLQQQTVCFLCTVNRKNICAINHRGGAAGFLLALPPERCSPGGRLLLPDYQGNGAFEAVGNIFETGLATLIIPDYSMHLALIIAGKARVLERAGLSSDLQAKYKGAERFIDIAVQQIDMQHGDWAPSLAYTQTIVNTPEKAEDKLLCPVLV
ncbi:MAG TPA: pyridoxamine 5'-phosphate oxidase family protein, partial [Ktedonobacteraceae bacterium]|nr:pyridoxamine 5'-phosphate oxidase family protein [Ktedonobacteraceae bacterium]